MLVSKEQSPEILFEKLLRNIYIDAAGSVFSSCCANTNNSLDLLNKTITLEQEDTKTKKGRLLNLKPATCTLLKNWMDVKDPNWEDWLFPSYEGKRLRIQRLDVDFKK